jgi:branched-subunit amino acid ABC-type transport system permease component
MTWGMLPTPHGAADWTFRFILLYGAYFPAYRAFMLLVSAGMLLVTWLLLKKTRIGPIIQAALSHPNMVSALGHKTYWLAVFTTAFAGGRALAGLAGVIGGSWTTAVLSLKTLPTICRPEPRCGRSGLRSDLFDPTHFSQLLVHVTHHASVRCRG